MQDSRPSPRNTCIAGVLPHGGICSFGHPQASAPQGSYVCEVGPSTVKETSKNNVPSMLPGKGAFSAACGRSSMSFPRVQGFRLSVSVARAPWDGLPPGTRPWLPVTHQRRQRRADKLLQEECGHLAWAFPFPRDNLSGMQCREGTEEGDGLHAMD